MTKKTKQKRPATRLPKGMRDIESAEIRATNGMIARIRDAYESYGFEPLETPAFEYTDALGKFLPDSDRPNEGVFSFQDEDEQWLSLRYDLTAPLARYVAQHFDALPKPFRRYAYGPVWRNEKPGPGRFRQFMQFDADTVGTTSVAADAEMCMLAADTLEALGFKRGDYVIKVNNRKIFDGLMEVVGLAGPESVERRLIALRAIDKRDRIGSAGVEKLLGSGRTDDSGDHTQGAGLDEEKIATLMEFTSQETESFMPLCQANLSKDHDEELIQSAEDNEPYVLVTAELFQAWRETFTDSQIGTEGVQELEGIWKLVQAAGYGTRRIKISPTVIRGLEYYTGPVFEAELTFKAKDDKGRPIRFGSVGGGGRYDNLVTRFTGRPAPATGFSIGVSRLQAALAALGRETHTQKLGAVVVLVMDPGELPRYQAMAQTLRAAGIRAEMYLGTSGMKAQMKYADKRGAPCVIIQGEDEIKAGEVQIKDLIEGAKAAQSIKDNKEWKETRPAQFAVKESNLAEEVKKVLARHSTNKAG